MKKGTYRFHQRQWRKWGKRIVKGRMARGVCLSCDTVPETNPRTGRRFLRCDKHRAAAQAGQNPTRAEQRAHWRAHGNCIVCDKPCGVNPSNGRKFSRCLTHRLQNTAAAARRREKNNSKRLSIFVAIAEQ